MKLRRTVIALATASVIASLTACGGGGGGGGGYGAGGNPYLRAEVPYYTPVRVATVDPLTNITGTSVVFDMFNADITGSGADVVIAGRQTGSINPDPTNWSTSKITLMSWQNGTLVDKTAQWFPGGINEILGTEPSIKFADFFKTGRTDMFVAPSTDSQYYGPAYVFLNQGDKFSRLSIPLNNVWAHDSAVGDVNNDTYRDIVVTDYGPNSSLIINDRVSNFKVYQDYRGQSGDLRWGGSGVTMGDFLQNGSTQFVFTDNSCNTVNPSCSDQRVNKLYSYTIDASDRLSWNYISDLPTARFDLPKWSSYGFTSHNVRAVSYDFNDDGKLDVIIFSRPNGNWNERKYSEIQFVKNLGSGSFSDVTDTVLVNYNTNTYSTYNPKFIDINGDGLVDILVSGSDYSGNNTSTQALLKSSDGKYVAAYQNIFTDFIKQTGDMTGITGDGNTVNIFKAPNGKLYLMTMVGYQPGSDRKLAVYLSELGSQNVTTAKNAIALIQQKWPYMSAIQANDTLAKTSAAYLGGLVIDLESALSPIGQLAVNGRVLSGYITGLKMETSQAWVTDSLQRPFSVNLDKMNVTRLNSFQFNTEHIDQHNLTSHAEYLINGSVMNINGLRIGNENQMFTQLTSNGLPAPTPSQYTMGIPNLYSNGNFNYGAQFTKLNSNPWIAFGGSWGSVTGSTVFDNVFSYQKDNFTAKASLMYVTTTINPGMITNVAPMLGYWTETGYRWNFDSSTKKTFGLYLGTKPAVFHSQIDAMLPTDIDRNGQLLFSKTKLSVDARPTPYGRALYTEAVTKNLNWTVAAIYSADNQYRITNELKYYWR